MDLKAPLLQEATDDELAVGSALLSGYYSHSYGCGDGDAASLSALVDGFVRIGVDQGWSSRCISLWRDLTKDWRSRRCWPRPTMDYRARVIRRDISLALGPSLASVPGAAALLDLGAGSHLAGWKVARSLLPLARYDAVDRTLTPDALDQFKMTAMSEARAFNSVDALVAATAPGTYTHVLVRYALHHTPPRRQQEVVARVRGLCRDDAHVVLVEDDFSAASSPVLCQQCARFSESFRDQPVRVRRAVIALNDVWANCVVYGGNMEDQFHGFRSEDSWGELFEAAGFRRKRLWFRGFDCSRYHGVPSTLSLFAALDPIAKG